MKTCSIWKHSEIPEDELIDCIGHDDEYFYYEGLFWPLSWIFWPNEEFGYICQEDEPVVQVCKHNGKEIDVGPYNASE